MKALRLFSLALVLSACQSAQQPAATPSSPFSSVTPTMSTPQPNPASLNQQILSFPQPRSHFRLSLSEEGNGIFVTGARESAEPLGIHIINRFVLQDELLNYPSLISRQAADYTLFLSEQGQGQVIAVNTPGPHDPSGVQPAIAMPPENAPLELRTITLSDFKPDSEPTTLTFPESFSGIKLGQRLVDSSGNGYLSLYVTDPVTSFPSAVRPAGTPRPPAQPAPASHWVFVPIRSHRVQSTLDKGVDLSGVSGQITSVWLNADKNGLVLYNSREQQWFLREIRQGQLGEQIVSLGGPFRMSAPEVRLDASGNGYVYLLQKNGVQQTHPVRLFSVGPAQILELPPLSPDSFVVFDFKGDQGTLVEVPNTPLNRISWDFKVHHLDQGRLRDSRILSYPLGSTEIPALGVGLSISSRGDGLFAWSTLEQGGINGKIHIQTLDNFQIAGTD